MKTRTGHISGFSLVELLVVLAIAGLISAVVLPTFVRGSFLGGAYLEGSADALYGVLRAARIYATTNNVETAVVYVGDRSIHQYTEDTYAVLNAYAIVRRARESEMDLYYPNMNRDSYPFIALTNWTGGFRSMKGNTCVRIGNLDDPISTDIESLISDEYERMGVVGLSILDPNYMRDIEVANEAGDWRTLEDLRASAANDQSYMYIEPCRPESDCNFELYRSPPYGTGCIPNQDFDTFRFPGHKFLPTGALFVPDYYPRERMKIVVAPLPDIGDFDGARDGQSDAEAVAAEPKKKIFIQKSTGRIKYAS